MTAQPPNPSLQAVVPLIAAIIGAIFGGLFTFGSSYYVQLRRTKQRRKRLRRAFVGELRLSDPDSVLNRATSISKHLRTAFRDETDEELDVERLKISIQSLENSYDMNLSREVYDENLSDIGMFNGNEIDSLLRYYRVMGDCEREIRKLEQNINNGTLGGGDAEVLKATLSQLKAEKSRLLEALNASQIKEPDGYADIREREY
jgi:hypothetical protein